MVNRIKWVLLLAALIGLPPAWASTQDAVELVRSTSNQVLEKIIDKKQELNRSPEKIFDLVNATVAPHFDFPRMSRMVLGKYWRKASDEQKQAFIKQFQALLVRTYAIALLNYSDQAIIYLPPRTQADTSKVMVRTEVKSSGAPAIPINYRLRLNEGSWKVYDVIIDNISLVSNYRTGFSNQIRRKGLDSLIAQLKEKNDKVTQ